MVSSIDDLLNNAPCGFLSFADDGTILLVNATLGQWLGYEPEELMGRPIDFILPMAARIFYQTHFFPLLKVEGKSEEMYFSLKTRQGESLAVLTSAVRSKREGAFISDCVFLPMRQRREFEDELVQAKKVADEASKAKAQFLSMMSHELRTPLNAIMGFGQLLQMDELEPLQLDSVQQITKAGRHLLDVINEVLDISRISAGRLEISLEAVSSREVMQEAFQMARPLADKAGIQMAVQPQPDSEEWVEADRGRLRQVLLNLLANAIKYNREGGRVTLRCERSTPESESVRFEVLDTGRGIAPDDLEKLFVPFERLGAEAREIEGTGLGLALCQRLTEAMNGTIGVQSTPGEGSCFWVELPAASPDDENALEVFETRNSAFDELPARVASLLYIEDNASHLELMQRILLRRPDIHLLSATTGEAGLQIARTHHPDMILLDVHLPDINGTEVLKQLRAQTDTKQIPVVMLSVDAAPHQIERLLEAGAVEYITKPLEVRRFLKSVDRILAERM